MNPFNGVTAGWATPLISPSENDGDGRVTQNQPVFVLPTVTPTAVPGVVSLRTPPRGGPHQTVPPSQQRNVMAHRTTHGSIRLALHNLLQLMLAADDTILLGATTLQHPGVDPSFRARLPVVVFSAATKGKDEESQMCTICMERYKDGEKLLFLPCLHRYHEACIIPWTENHRSCPICKTLIAPLPSIS